MALATNYSRNPTLRQTWITHIKIMSMLLKIETPNLKGKTEDIKEIFKKLDKECKEKGLKK